MPKSPQADRIEAVLFEAKNAGMIAVWFNPDNKSAPEHDIIPDHIIRRLDELPAFLE